MSSNIIHLRGVFPTFFCGEAFRNEYALNGDVSQAHTACRDKSTCEACNKAYDEYISAAEEGADAQ